jgi:hypothetical protein
MHFAKHSWLGCILEVNYYQRTKFWQICRAVQTDLANMAPIWLCCASLWLSFRQLANSRQNGIFVIVVVAAANSSQSMLRTSSDRQLLLIIFCLILELLMYLLSRVIETVN